MRGLEQRLYYRCPCDDTSWRTSVKGSKSWIRNRILLSLDQRPCHGYDLLKSLPKELNDLRLTTLYRWLHTMESEGYVESDIRPGPHGPDRRIYRLGPRGENRLRDLLKESIETVLHFYDAYRYSVGSQLYMILKDMKPERVEGRTLFAAIPWLRSQELDIIRFLAERNNGSGIDILGDTSFLRGEEIKTKELKGDIVDIPASNDKYAEIWLSGVPFRENLQRALSECKRVLAKGGVLRVIAPFAYFGEPERPTVDEFIRVTAVHLLPDLGVVEGRDVASLMESLFSACGALETLPGLVVFWAEK